MLFVYLHVDYAGEREQQLQRSLIPLEAVDLQGGQEDICAICMQGMDTGEAVSRVRRCQHVFHDSCIRHWIALKDQCPICRAII